MCATRLSYSVSLRLLLYDASLQTVQPFLLLVRQFVDQEQQHLKEQNPVMPVTARAAAVRVELPRPNCSKFASASGPSMYSRCFID